MNEKYIQVMGYRKALDKNTGKPYVWQKHFDHIKVTSIIKLFQHLDEVVSLIPEEERWDVHFTNANCETTSDSVKLRTFAYQEMIPVDLDDIDLSRKGEYIDIVCRILKIDYTKTFVSCSGNGVHMIIALTQRIESGDELHRLQPYYRELCTKINIEFFNNGLPGTMDPVRLAQSATLRLPKTLNLKDEENPKETYVIQKNIEPQAFYLDGLINIVEEKAVERSLRAIDTKAVLSGCPFLKHLLDNSNSITEPQWYAGLGILAFIPDIGINLCHTYSEKHPDYSYEDTQTKAEQALGFGKPRTCDSVHQVFPGCASCPHFKKCHTPLNIIGDDFIRTETTGFHDVVESRDGSPKKFIPNYGDLMKFFTKNHTYVVNQDSRQLSIFNGTHWANFTDIQIDGFATNKFEPLAKNTMRSEFKSLLLSTNLVDTKFFGKDNSGHVNFKNGVLRIRDRQLLPHSPEFGFNYVLPYDYNPHAKCPEFDTMMDNVTISDKAMQNLLLEYVGYAISGMRASYGAKALILTGTGSNGKSTFLNVIKMLVGEDCFSTVSLEDMSDANNRYSMVSKLFNICEEVEENELKRGTAIFKSVVTGANMMVKKLYSDTVSMRIDTKLILSCNELPPSKENTYAIYRRMLIVPFKAQFTKTTGVDKHIEDRIAREMSGVYNRVLEAFDRLLKNEGAFSESEAANKALADYRYLNSIYNQFSDNCLTRTNNKEDSVSIEEIVSAYNGWAAQNNQTYKPTNIKLTKELKTIGVIVGEAEVMKVNGVSKRKFRGLRINNNGAF